LDRLEHTGSLDLRAKSAQPVRQVKMAPRDLLVRQDRKVTRVLRAPQAYRAQQVRLVQPFKVQRAQRVRRVLLG